MRILPLLATVSAITLIASTASAEERWPRWYVGLAGSVNFVEDSDLSGAINGDLGYDVGGGANVSLGYMPHFGDPVLDNLRFEVEAGVRFAQLDTFSNAGVNSGARDNLRMFTYMANGYYDFRSDTQWTPYLGLGIGQAKVSLDNNSGLGNTDEDDTVLAYQGMLGMMYAPSSMPHTEWGFGYRYFRADSPEFSTATGRLSFDDVASHNVEVNAKFRF